MKDGAIDLDMSLVRAFVATAEELHFGRAAERLTLSQQALSKRVRRLEDELGVPLFDRSTRSVRPTDAGRRLLGPARDALAAADAVVAAAQGASRALRADVLHERLAPALMMRRLSELNPTIPVELSSRRSLAMAVPALLRGEVDLTFGRLSGPRPRTLAHRVVRLEPLVVLVGAGHPLAGQRAVRPADLAAYGVWTPTPGSASEWSGYVDQFARTFDFELRHPRVDNVTSEEVLERSSGGGPVFLSAADVDNPVDPQLRLLPLVDPVPLYPWSLVWRTAERHPLVLRAVAALSELSADEGWCTPVDGLRWLPSDTTV
ncbi:LysR family transcriptional regulator [Kitasatospora sp. NPDC004531]